MKNPNVTRDGIEVKVGQLWRSTDKRDCGYCRKVLRVENGKADLAGPRRTVVSVCRMYRHSTGYELVKP
jgi:hypothetical protein